MANKITSTMDMGTDNDRPTLNATLNQTACWTSHSPGCSYNPWGEIAVKTNGGVPQAANLSLHSAALKAGLDNQMPDKESSGFLVIDWEAWRPDSKECDDGLSSYLEYSRRLVLADATWPVATQHHYPTGIWLSRRPEERGITLIPSPKTGNVPTYTSV